MIFNNDIVKNILQENNCRLIGEIKSSQDKLAIMDDDGYIFYMTIYNFVQASKVVQFNSNNPYTIENIKTWVKNNDYDIELLSKEFINSKTDLEWKCNRCGNIFYKSWKKIKDKSNGKYCGECNQKDRQNHQKITFKNNLENYIDDMKNIGYTVFRDCYTNKNKSITIMDSEGYLYYKSYNQCLKKEPIKTEHVNPYSIYNIKHWIKINNYNLEVLEEEFIDNSTKLRLRCLKCGAIFMRSWNSLEVSKYKCCDDCTRKTMVTNNSKEMEIINKGYKILSEYNGINKYINLEDGDGFKYRSTYGALVGNKSVDKFNKSNPFTIENINNYIKLNNLKVKLLSLEFVDSTTKLLWECDCGNTFERNHSNVLFNNQCKCRECAMKSRIEKTAFSLEYIKNKINELGYELIESDTYKINGKISIIDKGGYKYYVKFANIVKGHMPLIYVNTNPYSLENIKNYIKINNINSELLSIKYNGQHSPLTFTCKICGQPYTTTPNRYINNNKQQCNNCGQEIKNKKHRLSYEHIKNITKEKGYTLLSTTYSSQRELLDIIDTDGYKYKVDFTQIKNSGKLLKFYDTNPYTVYNINNYIKLNNLNVKLVSDKYKGATELMMWECSCGEYFETSWDKVLGQHRIRCKKCSKIQSIIENKTEIWLKNNDYIYKTQVWFEDCKDIRPMPFDFAIYDNDEELTHLIECDGRQHFEKVRWSDLMTQEEIDYSFQLTQYHDELKNEYCNKNKINLIRIPYWEFKNDNYLNILENRI